MSDRILRFVGRDSHGKVRSGALLGSPADIVERYYRAGWQSLAVTRDDVNVGTIEPAFRPADRTWTAFDDVAGVWVMDSPTRRKADVR